LLVLKAITFSEGECPFLKNNPLTFKKFPLISKLETPSIKTLPGVSALKLIGLFFVPSPTNLISASL
jgi:hypothetical protein